MQYRCERSHLGYRVSPVNQVQTTDGSKRRRSSVVGRPW
jgi:hypothetical protein